MNGNPAQLVILENAKTKIENNEPLTEVERVVLREYVTFTRSRLHSIELKSQHQMLSETEYAKMQGYQEEISKYGGG